MYCTLLFGHKQYLHVYGGSGRMELKLSLQYTFIAELCHWYSGVLGLTTQRWCTPYLHIAYAYCLYLHYHMQREEHRIVPCPSIGPWLFFLFFFFCFLVTLGCSSLIVSKLWFYLFRFRGPRLGYQSSPCSMACLTFLGGLVVVWTNTGPIYLLTYLSKLWSIVDKTRSSWSCVSLSLDSHSCILRLLLLLRPPLLCWQELQWGEQKQIKERQESAKAPGQHLFLQNQPITANGAILEAHMELDIPLFLFSRPTVCYNYAVVFLAWGLII